MQSQKMLMKSSAYFLVLEILAINVLVIHCQPTPDSSSFINIDCGIDNGATTVDASTGLTYVSDDAYTDLGMNCLIDSSYFSSTRRIQSTLHSFPDGTRSCYALRPIVQYYKYLVRASFTYGNYDGLHKANPIKPLQFDLYIDVNFWTTVNVTDESATYSEEVLTVALAKDSISVCLVNTGNGVPFISSLELRHIDSYLYQAINTTFSLILLARLNAGTNDTIRYPTDPYDRVWRGWTRPSWTDVATTSPIGHYLWDDLRAPSAVMQTAVTTSGDDTKLLFGWNFAGTGFRNNEFYANLHFSEFDALDANQSRVFNILLNGDVRKADYSPPYLMADAVYSIAPLTQNLTYRWELSPVNASTLRPVLNALEVFSTMYLTNVMTNTRDVDAINAIKAHYKVNKYWTGDPCSPREYAWDGLNCSYNPDPPNITALNLSSSGLTGEISTHFRQLAAIIYLDLSYNNLTGKIPDVFGDLSSLKVLYLMGTNVSKQIPSSFNERINNGLLEIIFDNAPPGPMSPSHKSKTLVIVFAVIGGVVALIAVVFILWCTWKSYQGPVSTPGRNLTGESSESNEFHCSPHLPLPHAPPTPQADYPHDRMKFTYARLINITNNFSQKIGQGGFGFVYHGCLETGKEVAVKVHSQSSLQGAKQFMAETQNLTRVHHKNLVELIGYCIDDIVLGLVYEYMTQGNLHEHLKGNYGKSLSWRERLKIAIGAAEGLEYLHKSCHPPIIHRDIKSSNILLGANLEAKIADFGLSKSYSSDNQTYVSTDMAVGTPGYLDPQYHNTLQLTYKSDVFSFGVVLFELLTGQLPLLPISEKPHIMQRVTSKLANAPIEDIMDPRLGDQFDVNSAWKIEMLAERCTKPSGSQRPSMTEVVTELKDSLVLEDQRLMRLMRYGEDYGTSQISSFEVEVNQTGPSGPFAR